MSSPKFSASLALALLAAGPLTSFADDSAVSRNWHQWRGPLSSGVAPLASPPSEWSESRNVKWKTPYPGAGTSSPIVWEDKVFLTSAVPTGRKMTPIRAPQDRPAPPGITVPDDPTEVYRFLVLCYDRGTGNLLWQRIVREELPHEGHHQDHGFASMSPTTDGERLYAWFGSRGLHCFDLDGNLLWEKDLGKMQSRFSFGEGSSPVLSGDKLFILWDHEGEDDYIVAFDKLTGKELWRNTNRTETTTWSTPLVVDHEGKKQIVVSASNRVRSYDANTGTQIWETAGMTVNAIPTPVAGFGMVFPISGFRGSSLMAIRLGATGDLTDSAAIAWRHNRSTPYIPSPLLYDHRLYFMGGNNAMISVFDVRSGKQLVNAERLTGMFGVYASPVGADGRVYVIGRDGGAVVLRNADQIEVLAVNKLDDRFDASPAIAGRELFLRGHESLYCIAAP